jgi:predicted enzyme related to lactoylglutathione lyase
MSIRTSPWPVGTPCWVDLATADPLAASAFYSQLLGWEVRPGPPAAGGYRMAVLRGSAVAGIRPAPPGGPSTWTTYLASADVGATVREVMAAGGGVELGPVSLLSEAVIALAQDPTGVPFGVWEAGRLIGAQLVNEPGGFCWAELLSRDVSTSRHFHDRVFGHAYSDHGGDDFSYDMIRVDGTAVSGIAAIGPPRSGEPPTAPQWLVYFSVDDTDAVSARAQALGGRIELSPTETPHGRMSLLRGRSGELFGVLQADDLPRETPGVPE